MAHSIADIEDAVLAALKPTMNLLQVLEVKPYAGEIAPEEIETARVWPFCLVTFNGVAEVADHGNRKIESGRWLVLVGDRDRRDLAKARRGGGDGPGTYAMIRAAHQALEGKLLLPGLHPVRRLGEDTIVNEAGMSVYACHYEIQQGYLV